MEGKVEEVPGSAGCVVQNAKLRRKGRGTKVKADIDHLFITLHFALLPFTS
jgi:hypothetical protein